MAKIHQIWLHCPELGVWNTIWQQNILTCRSQGLKTSFVTGITGSGSSGCQTQKREKLPVTLPSSIHRHCALKINSEGSKTRRKPLKIEKISLEQHRSFPYSNLIYKFIFAAFYSGKKHFLYIPQDDGCKGKWKFDAKEGKNWIKKWIFIGRSKEESKELSRYFVSGRRQCDQIWRISTTLAKF